MYRSVNPVRVVGLFCPDPMNGYKKSGMLPTYTALSIMVRLIACPPKIPEHQAPTFLYLEGSLRLRLSKKQFFANLFTT